MDEPVKEFSALDLIGVFLTLGVAGTLVTLPLSVGPTFAQMFRDFGGPMPALTGFALHPWSGALLSAPAFATTLIGARRRAPIHRRRQLVAGGFVLAAAAFGFWISCVYLPVFQISGAIK
jgi:type II secretory pathway component PulF